MFTSPREFRKFFLASAQRPRPNRYSWALATFSMLPPDPTRRRLQRLHDFEAATGLRYPLSMLHELRCRPIDPLMAMFNAVALMAMNPHSGAIGEGIMILGAA